MTFAEQIVWLAGFAMGGFAVSIGHEGLYVAAIIIGGSWIFLTRRYL